MSCMGKLNLCRFFLPPRPCTTKLVREPYLPNYYVIRFLMEMSLT